MKYQKYSHYVNIGLMWERKRRAENSDGGKAETTTMCSGNPDTTEPS